MDDEWAYAAIVEPLLSFVEEGHLEYFRAPAAEAGGSASLTFLRRPGAGLLMQSAITCLRSRCRPKVMPLYKDLKLADLQPLSEQKLQCHRTAALYLLALTDHLQQNVRSEEDSDLVEGLFKSLAFLCQACASRRTLPGSLAHRREARVLTNLRCMTTVEGWERFERVLEDRETLSEGMWQQLAIPIEPADAAEWHWQDLQIMTPLLDGLKEAALSPSGRNHRLLRHEFVALAAFFGDELAWSRMNAEWTFQNGAAHLSRVLTELGNADTQPGSSSAVIFFFNLLIEGGGSSLKDHAGGRQLQRATFFARTGVYKIPLACCLHYDDLAADLSDGNFIDSARAMSHFLGTKDAGKMVGLWDLAQRLLQFTVRKVISGWGEGLAAAHTDWPTFGAMAPHATGNEMGQLVLSLAAQIISLFGKQTSANDPPRRGGPDPLCILRGLIAALEKMYDVDVKYKEFLEGVPPAEKVHELLCILLDVDPGPESFPTFVWETGAIVDIIFLLLRFYSNSSKYSTGPGEFSKVTVEWVTLDLRNSNGVHRFLDQKKAQNISVMWRVICDQSYMPQIRWSFLTILAEIAEHLEEPETPKKAHISLAFELRQGLVDAIPALRSEFGDAEESQNWAIAEPLIIPLMAVLRLVSVLFDPTERVLPNARDADKDVLLDFCSQWLCLKIPTGVAPDSLGSRIVATIYRLSTAIQALVVQKQDPAVPKTSVSRGTEAGVRAAVDSLTLHSALGTFLTQECRDAPVGDDGYAGTGDDAPSYCLSVGIKAMTWLASTSAVVLLEGGQVLKPCSDEEAEDVSRADLALRLRLWHIVVDLIATVGEHIRRIEYPQIILDLLFNALGFAGNEKDRLLRIEGPEYLLPLMRSLKELTLFCIPMLYHLTSATLVMMAVLETELSLLDSRVKPGQWTDFCKQGWQEIMKMREMQNLQQPLSARLNLLRQKLKKLGRKPAAQEADGDGLQARQAEEAMQELLAEEALKERAAAKKAKKKQNKQAARKNKTQSEAVGDAQSREVQAAEDPAHPAGSGPADSAPVDPHHPESSDPHGSEETRALSPSARHDDGASSSGTASDARPEGRARTHASMPDSSASAVPPPRLTRPRPAAKYRPMFSGGSTAGLLADESANRIDIDTRVFIQSGSASQPEAAADRAESSSMSAAPLAESLMDEMEELYTCPITHEVLRDPVAASDGFTYERVAIEEWIRKSGNSPMTGGPLCLKDLHPNLLVKQMIAALLRR